MPDMNDEAEIRRYITKLKKRVTELENAITENKRVEEVLRESNEKFRDMAELLPEIIYECDPQGNITFVNKTAFEKYDLIPEDLDKGVNVQQFITPEDRKRLGENIDKILRGIGKGPIEYTALRKDGSAFPIVTYSSQIIRDGKSVGIRGIAIDITERKQMEEALGKSEEELNVIFNGARDGIVLLDKTGKILRINKYIVEIGGYAEEEFVGKHFNALKMFPPKSLLKMTSIFSKLIKGQEISFEVEVKTKKGKDKIVEVHNSFLKKEGKVEGVIAILRDITERKKSEVDLLESEEKYRTLFETAQDGIFVLDSETGKTVLANIALAKLFGFESPEDIIGLSPFDFIPEEDRARMTKIIVEDMFENDLREVMEYRAITKNSKEIWVSAVGVRIVYRGKMAGLVTVRDITEREKVKKELLRQKLQYQGIFEASKDALLILDMKGVIREVNPTACEMYGYSYEEMIGLSGKDIVHSDYQYLFKEIVKETSAGRTFHAESVDIHKNGSTFNIEVRVNSFEYEGKPHILAVIRDITERKQVENQILELKEFNEEIVNNLAEGIILENDDGIIQFANPEMLRMLGYENDELVGKHWNCFVPDNQVEIVKNARKRRLKGESDQYEMELIKKSGERISVFVSGVPHRQKGIYTGLLVVFIDITERNKVEEEKEKLQVQLTQAQKMESVGRLAGGVAHDFNNMLGVILGYTGIAMEQIDRNQPLYSYLMAIRKAAERSTALTQQLLAFARKQTINPRVLDLNVTVKGMLKMLQQIIGEDIDLALLPGVGVWSVKIDPSQIDQILANLCVNARDAIDDVGKIIIETNTVTFDETYCTTHQGFYPGEYVLLSVSDNGCGMDKETLDKIFDPFFTTKEIGKGTGLGLSTVYGIVKQNNGFINVYSEPGHGTTFKIYIPRHSTRITEMQKEGQVKSPQKGYETILLVEDELALLEMTQRMLEILGYTVLSASTPGEAIRLIELHTSKIHLLLTDVVMPEMNGRDLVRKLLPEYPNLKYLFMSGYTSNVITHHGVMDEGVKFLQKPFSEEKLAAKVREVLDCK